MDEPDSNRQASYPRQSVCGRCSRPLDPSGWCPKCAKRRALAWGCGTMILVPALGFGACLMGFNVSNGPSLFFYQMGCFLIPIGLILGPIIFATLRNGRN